MGGRDHARWRQTEEVPCAEALPTAAVDNLHVRGVGFGRHTTMSTANEIATTRFLSGYNCAQAVLCAFCAEASLSEDAALKIATGLGAGMGRKQEVCGAVTGGILVLGLRHGRDSMGDRSATELTYLKTRELMDRWIGSPPDTGVAFAANCCKATTLGPRKGSDAPKPTAWSPKSADRACRPSSRSWRTCGENRANLPRQIFVPIDDTSARRCYPITNTSVGREAVEMPR